MKAKYSEERNRWKIIVPPALTGTGKRAVNYFETKEKAEAEIRRILGRGTSAAPKVTDTEHAALVLAKQMGISEQQFLSICDWFAIRGTDFFENFHNAIVCIISAL